MWDSDHFHQECKLRDPISNVENQQNAFLRRHVEPRQCIVNQKFRDAEVVYLHAAKDLLLDQAVRQNHLFIRV